MTNASKTTDNAVVIPFASVAKLMHKLEETAAEFTDDNAAVRIADELLSVETEEELFALNEGSTIGSKDFLLKPFLLGPAGVKFLRSDQTYVDEGAFPFYALLTVTDLSDGVVKIVNCGSLSVISVISKLLSWHESGRDTFTAFEESERPFQFITKQTRSGQDVVKIIPVALAPVNAKKSK